MRIGDPNTSRSRLSSGEKTFIGMTKSIGKSGKIPEHDILLYSSGKIDPNLNILFGDQCS